MSEWVNWLFNVTINDISVIYVTAHRCAGGLKKKLDLRSGSQRHRNFVGFFNVSVLAPTRDHPFIRWFRHTAPFSRLLRSRWVYGGHILDLTPRALTGALPNYLNLGVVYVPHCKEGDPYENDAVFLSRTCLWLATFGISEAFYSHVPYQWNLLKFAFLLISILICMRHW